MARSIGQLESVGNVGGSSNRRAVNGLRLAVTWCEVDVMGWGVVDRARGG